MKRKRRHRYHNFKNEEERRTYWLDEHKAAHETRKREMPVLYKAERLLYYSKVRSKEKKLPPPTIDIAWIIKEIFKGCCRTGRKFIIDNCTARIPDQPSIHRLDNSKGYSPDNCEMVIWAYNGGLGEHSEKDMYKMFEALFKRVDHDE